MQTHAHTAMSANKWKFVGKSAIGTRHEKNKNSCQDACKCQYLSGGELVIAVADGAGSALLSKQGATQAVDVAVKYLRTAAARYKPNTSDDWKSIVAYSFEVARGQLIWHATSQAKMLKNYHTTLQVIVASDGWTISAIVGDGTAVGLKNDNSLIRLMNPQQGEYANATNFITSDFAPGKIAIQVFQEPLVGIAVLTDGLLTLALDEKDNTPYPGFFVPLFKFLDASKDNQQANKGLKRFLSSDRVNKRTDDDKTLVLALRSSVQKY